MSLNICEILGIKGQIGIRTLSFAFLSHTLSTMSCKYRRPLLSLKGVQKPWRRLTPITFSSQPHHALASNYIVTFKKGTPASVIEEQAKKAEEAGATIKHRYNSAILGYAISVPDGAIGTFDVSHPDVDFVEADGEVTTQGKQFLTSN
jgi:hypothetical protein